MAQTAKKSQAPAINELKHPHYLVNEFNWFKWRLTAMGGSEFLRKYLVKFSKLEDAEEYERRKLISYVPAFAKKGLNKVRNAVFKRMTDIVRTGGPKSYQDACTVQDVRGVDMQGSSMTTYIGREILPELLSMARVGVYVDMPVLDGPTMADKGNKRPYLYTYRAETIRSWSTNRNGDPAEFTALLLQDTEYECDERWELLPFELVTKYRYIWIDNETGFVNVKFYNLDIDAKGNPYWAAADPIQLNIRKIPFVVFGLSDSLLCDAADYQIALLNLNSADLAYALKANYPVYTEQVDWRSDSPHLKQSNIGTNNAVNWSANTTSVVVNQDQIREIRIGSMGGRQYPTGVERPGFIHPSPDPLRVSMEKEEQMKREIDELITHSLSTLSPTQESQRANEEDDQSAGLHYIGLSLEHGERKIAEYWAMYEGVKPATVNYPSDYTLLSEMDRQQRATFYKDMIPHIPSQTAQKRLALETAKTLLANRTDVATMNKITAEINSSVVIYSDPIGIASDLEQGLVTRKTASLARGYPEGEADAAKDEYAERLDMIATSQAKHGGTGALANGDNAQARGVRDLGANQNAGKEEKTASQKNQDTEPTPHDKTRGTANA